jgi:hypothetical protein
LDASCADDEAGLTKLLRDDIGRGIGVEKAMSNDLTYELIGTAVMGFGATGMALQGHSATFLEKIAELKIALFRETEGGGGLKRAEVGTFTGVKHGELKGDFIIRADSEFATGPNEGTFLEVEDRHEARPPRAEEKRKSVSWRQR